jgi:hypothetical protein
MQLTKREALSLTNLIFFVRNSPEGLGSVADDSDVDELYDHLVEFLVDDKTDAQQVYETVRERLRAALGDTAAITDGVSSDTDTDTADRLAQTLDRCVPIDAEDLFELPPVPCTFDGERAKLDFNVVNAVDEGDWPHDTLVLRHSTLGHLGAVLHVCRDAKKLTVTFEDIDGEVDVVEAQVSKFPKPWTNLLDVGVNYAVAESEAHFWDGDDDESSDEQEDDEDE